MKPSMSAYFQQTNSLRNVRGPAGALVDSQQARYAEINRPVRIPR